MQKFGKVQSGLEALCRSLPAAFRPEIGIILGTGLGCIAEGLRESISIPYAEIPDYPCSTVKSHAGRFLGGTLFGRKLIMQDGRCHLYEGYSAEEVVRGVRIMAALGVKTLIVTNAAGSLNPLFMTGSIMAITDHINFTGTSPLTGILDEPGQSRFVDMSCPYDANLLQIAQESAVRMNLRLEQGVYLGLSGPQMESRAETRMFRAWGADAVGMSTVMEVLAARHLNLRVLAFSVLSNQNLPDRMVRVNLEDVVENAGQATQKLGLLLNNIIPELE
ncbi:MAG: purine-nucleoside phosphorylase [Deltaproteobacteria bacterium]|nr:purine-nucleoside phosphorylase [Deltaproteobacteria bacterium]